MKLYFVGICGSMMAQMAVGFKKQGYDVTGSDKGFYPPMSTYLEKNHIPMQIGYKESHIHTDIDVAVIGAAITENNPEYLEIKKLGIKHYMGYGGFLRDYFVKKDSIVVVGTYGKTTITGFITYLLDQAGYNPSYAIGGLPINYEDGVRLTDAPWSVCEGDEYINSRIEHLPRFLYYHPTYFVINAAKHDHLDVYKTEEEYIGLFQQGIREMPSIGCVIANIHGENMDQVLSVAHGQDIVRVSTNPNALDAHATIALTKIIYKGDETQFSVKAQDHISTYTTKLLGTHNIRNLVMGIALAKKLGITEEHIEKAVEGYKGIQRRLEIRREQPFLVIDDLAHSAVKAQSSIDAIYEKFPNRRLIALFEPHTLSSRLRSSLHLYTGQFLHTHEVLIAPVYHPLSVPQEERITSEDIAKAIGNQAKPFATFMSLKEYIEIHMQPDDILLFMTSGNFGGLIDYFSKRL